MAAAVLIVLVCLAVYCFTGKIPTVFRQVPALREAVPEKAEVLVLESGEGAGAAVDRAGTVYYLHRGSGSYGGKTPIAEDVILKLDPGTGEVLDKFGAGIFLSPHGLDVDSCGNLWVTDTALNKVIKLSASGELLARYGAEYPFYLETLYRLKNVMPRFPLPVNGQVLARPAGVSVLEDGSFLVADGYRNSRLAKFDRDGKLLWETGRKGTANGKFHLPHGVAQDRDGTVYVADRKNARVQVFSPEGAWLASWEDPKLGRPFAVAVGEDGLVYIADVGDMLDGGTHAPRSRIIVADRSGKVLCSFGSFGEKAGQLNIPHGIAVGKDGSVYVAELGNRRLQRFVRPQIREAEN